MILEMNSTTFTHQSFEPQPYLIMSYFGSIFATLAMSGFTRHKKILLISVILITFISLLIQFGIFLYNFGSPIHIPGLKEYLVNNQFLNGALFLSVVGLISYYAQQLTTWVKDVFYYKVVSTVIVNSRNP